MKNPFSKIIRTEIDIDASPARVWSIITDAARYAEWNPVHVRLEGSYAEGETMWVHLKEPSGKVSRFKSKVRHFLAGSCLNQGGGLPGMFTFNHTFTLAPMGAGTRVTQTEVFQGLGVLFFDTSWVSAAYESVNAALKQRAEPAV